MKVFSNFSRAMLDMRCIPHDDRATGDFSLTLQNGEVGKSCDGGHYDYHCFLKEMVPGIFQLKEWDSCDIPRGHENEDIGYIVLTQKEKQKLLETSPDDGEESGYWKPNTWAWLEKALA
jgi:hypothetical protein